MNKQLIFTIISLLLFVIVSQAEEKINMNRDFESLGGNEVLIKKAQALDPENRMHIVQKRLVDRHMRLEIGANFGGVAGGDSYVDSNLVGGNLEFHLNPHWSLGVRHQVFGNKLSNEGERVFTDAQGAVDRPYRDLLIDYPQNTSLAVVSFYPIYGKANIFDSGISQFDLYMLAGAGQMRVASGSSATFVAGGGIGFWLSQHFSARGEIRYQNYKDHLASAESRDINAIIGQLGLGFLL